MESKFTEDEIKVAVDLFYGADPNIPDGDGDLPIIGSIDTRRMDEIELLIQYGTDMNHSNNRGQTSLERAMSRGIGDEVQRLIR